MKEGYIPSPHIANLREQATLSEKPKSVQPIGVESGSFWDATMECLVEFHGKSHKEAFKMLTDYKARVRQLSPPELAQGVVEITRHDQPFYLANDLADNDLDPHKNIDKYNGIRERHGLLSPEKD
jgi:hypothetical protein